MNKAYSEGTEVEWQWGEGTARGKVEKVYTEHVTRTISGTEVTRNADEENPAYFIKQEDGDSALKSHSEVTKA